jgi:hypothetical protein
VKNGEAENFVTRRHGGMAALLVAFLQFVCSQSIAAVEDDLYLAQIRPLLHERCTACHGSLKQEAGLRLDTGILIRQGGDSGPAVVPGQPEESLLLQRVTCAEEDGRMPPLGMALTVADLSHLRDWIQAGATSPQFEEPEASPLEHWAFVPPLRHELPQVSEPEWCRNPVDRFLMAAWDREGLQHADDSPPALLLRRVFLDLTGLQPDASQLQKFLEHPDEAHFQSIVNQLLDSPQYGERWGRHWMDVWRYSDWYGRRQQNDVRNSAPQIWRWRDWIVRSLNADHGYDRMVQEMLAADELAAADDSAWPATGYLIRSYYSLNPNEWMRHNVEYTGKAFLGLTFNCAHCHDHKYDPIEQDDYFRLRAFFEPMGIRQDRVIGEPEPPPFEPYTYAGSRKVVREGMVRIFDEQPQAETWFYSGGDERNRQEDRGSIGPGVPRFLSDFFGEIQPQQLPRESWYPGARAELREAVLQEHQQQLRDAETALRDTSEPPPAAAAVLARVAAAESDFQAAADEAERAGSPGALAGKQSLLLDAGVNGRRLLLLDPQPLQSVPEGAEIQFRLRLLRDGQMNLQLARDSVKLLTALFVEFSAGEIRSYQPGTFNSFVVGRYAAVDGVADFSVTLQIFPDQDLAKLTVISGGTTIVDAVPVALNGWNAAMHPNQGIFLDCRAQTKLLFDDLVISTGDHVQRWDFEAPEFPTTADVNGIAGWRVLGQSVSPSSSQVSRTAGNPELQPLLDVLRAAEAELRTTRLPRLAAEQRVANAAAQLRRLQAVWAADDARDQEGLTDVERQRAFRAAAVAERDAAVSMALLQQFQAEQQQAAALLLPETDAGRADQLKQAAEKLAAAANSLRIAQQRQMDQANAVEYASFSPLSVKRSTGRRSALARWITDRRNPLTARVAVNHLWLRHFGRPLVESVFDFGRNGQHPSHPELLDWLAVELMENHWSMKHIHRLIVNSHAWRMSSSAGTHQQNVERDQDNRWLWKMRAGRMESEVIRDNLLALAGELDLSQGGQPLPNTQAMTGNRRSLYYEIFPEAGGNDPLAEAFDPPDPTECFRRTTTVLPQQALALSNSDLIHRVSGRIAERFEERETPLWISEAFGTILVREPTSAEQSLCETFLQRELEAGVDLQAARKALIRVLLNHNDFVTIR